ncbi:hypothetical protein Hanom_Chr10g00872811 [Helianthus anomalus]
MSSSSYTESSSSSDDGAEIFLQTIATVVKAIVENEEEEEESQQPKRRRRYIARERVTANDLLVSDYFSAEPKYDDFQPGNVTDQDKAVNEFWIKSRDIHHNLRSDLVEHVSTIPGFETDEDDEE